MTGVCTYFSVLKKKPKLLYDASGNRIIPSIILKLCWKHENTDNIIEQA